MGAKYILTVTQYDFMFEERKQFFGLKNFLSCKVMADGEWLLGSEESPSFGMGKIIALFHREEEIF